MSRKKILYQVDAFTDEPFKGNPAGVMILEEEVSASWMQSMAAEMNLSETAFLRQQGESYHIRYFTPLTEVPLCGHATLAASHILYETGRKKEGEQILFQARDETLAVRKEGEWLAMAFPAYPLKEIPIPDRFREIVGFEPVEMYSSRYGWAIAVASSEAEIRQAAPCFGEMTGTVFGDLTITAAAAAGDADFVVRCFAPAAGIDEDPVTGSVHCALVPLWSRKTGRTEFSSLQLSGRTGRLKLKLLEDVVEIQGRALTVLRAECFV